MGISLMMYIIVIDIISLMYSVDLMTNLYVFWWIFANPQGALFKSIHLKSFQLDDATSVMTSFSEENHKITPKRVKIKGDYAAVHSSDYDINTIFHAHPIIPKVCT